MLTLGAWSERRRWVCGDLSATVALSICLLMGIFALVDTPAQAKTFHKYESQIIEVPASSSCGPLTGLLRGVDAMTVFSGGLYVAESLAGQVPGFAYRVGEFASTATECLSQLSQQPGIAELRRGIAFGVSTGETEMYIGGQEKEGSRRSVVAAFGIGVCGSLDCASLQEKWIGADTPSGSFAEVRDVAVDHSTDAKDWASGDVFVADPFGHVVDVFKPETGGQEKYITQLRGTSPSEPFKFPAHVAISGLNGDVLVQDGSNVDLFEPAGLDEYAFGGRLKFPTSKFENIENVAMDDGNGEIYVATDIAIYEFSSTGAYLGEITGEETPEGVFSSASASQRPVSIAVDPASHRVFAGVFKSNANDSGVVDVFGSDITIPDVETEEPPSNLKLETEAESEAHKWSVKLNGMVDPDEAGEASCRFMWGTSKSFGQVAPCTSAVANGNNPVRVHASLNGLEPDTTYYYRLQAKNANGTNVGEEIQDREFTTPGPGLRSESASDASSSSATLEATIAPHNSPGSEHDLQGLAKSPAIYYFEYSTSNTIGCGATPLLCTNVPLAPESIGSGAADVEISQHLQGLQPGTAYHYRVVAANEALPKTQPGVYDEFYGPDQTFVTQGAGSSLVLPDGRAWELVSPVDKHGAVIEPIGETGIVQTAAGGEAFTYLTSLPTESEPQGYGGLVQVLAARDGTGWSSTDIVMPHSAPIGIFAGKGQEYRFFSNDLTLGVEESLGPFSRPESNHVYQAFPEATERTPYVRHNLTCEPEPTTCYLPLVTGAPGYEDVPPGTVFGGDPEHAAGEANFVGATPDASHIVLSSEVALTSTSNPDGGLYEWSLAKPATERLAPVSVLPVSEGGEAAAGAQFGRRGMARHAISDDGRRIFFSAKGATKDEHLYMRDMVEGQTVRLDLVEGQSGPTGYTPLFQTASTDGSVAFFTDQALTKDAGITGRDLYECEIVEMEEVGGSKSKCNLSDLTPEPSGLPSGVHEPAEVQGVLGASEDGSYLYFVANGVLTEGASPGDCGEGGSSAGTACNLYVRHDGVTHSITTLSGDDFPDWASDASSDLGHMTSRVSPNGVWLAFMSDRPLTGYDNRDARSGKPDEEVYLFDAITGKVVCASCDPTGVRPVGVEYKKLNTGLVGGDRVWGEEQWLAANVPGWTPYMDGEALYQSRYLSDGGRLFFNSSDPLVAQDLNGNEDVYEYEPVGVGGCGESSSIFSERSGGCVGLISSGTAPGESAFLDASASGSDVFFLTGESLVPQDVDGALDVYDAHECTSVSPCPHRLQAEPGECVSASSCRAAPLSQPSIFGAPSSATFAGAGNIVPPGPVGGTKPKKKTAAQIKAKKLAKALRACRKKPQRKRAACERDARKRYKYVKLSKASAQRRSRATVKRKAQG